MRIVDLVVAASLASVCIGVIAIMDPSPLTEEARRMEANSRARSLALSYIENQGFPSLSFADLHEICFSARRFGNESVGVNIEVDGRSCQILPPGSIDGRWSTSLELLGREVMVEAWVRRG